MTQQYSKFCGPNAFAAIVGCTAEQAADTLHALAVRDGWSFDGRSTETGLLAVALTKAGFTLERWSTKPHGWRNGAVHLWDRASLADLNVANENVRRINAEFDAALTPESADVIERWRPIRERRREKRRIDSLAVDQWLARFSRGTWVLCVHEHVLAARDGRIVAGDDAELSHYRFHALRNAWRVSLAKGQKEFHE